MEPVRIIGIEFYNRTATKLLIWVEMCCHELELNQDTEYRLESPETEYYFEITPEGITLWYQYSFGPKIFRRPYCKDRSKQAPWEFVSDSSDIAFPLPSPAPTAE